MDFNQKLDNFIYRYIYPIVIIGLLLLASFMMLLFFAIPFVHAADGDLSRFGNSTSATVLIGGTNGSLNMTGSAVIGANLTVGGNFSMGNSPAVCPGNNTFMTQFTGLTSTCTQVNVSAFNFIGTCAAGTVVQNVTATQLQCVAVTSGFTNNSNIVVQAPLNITSSGVLDTALAFNGSGVLWRLIVQNSGANLKILTPAGAVPFSVSNSAGSITMQNVEADSSYNGATAMLIKAASGMTVDMFQVQDSTGLVLMRVDKNGTLNASRASIDRIITGTNGMVPVLSTQEYFCDFQGAQSTNMCYPGFSGSGVSSGTSATVVGNISMPGIVDLRSTASANSGYVYDTSTSGLSLAGGEIFSATMSWTANNFANTSITRIGFFDSTNNVADTDCAMFRVTNGATVGATTCNNSITNSSGNGALIANYTLTANVSYVFIVKLSSDATVANFTLYQQSTSALVWNVTLTQDIPTRSGREVGAGINAVMTTAGSIQPIANVDNIYLKLPSVNRMIVDN